MWGDSSFAGGGGFINGATDSPSQSDKATKVRKTQNVIPVTIRQLLECQEETVKVEGFEANVVTIVGLVRAMETTATKVCMFLEDQTGTMECVSYMGTDGDGSNDNLVLAEGTYGRVVGALRTMKSNKYLIIFKAFPVTDLNELTCHLLEVLQIGTKLKKMRDNLDNPKPAPSGNENTFSNSMIAGGLGGPSGTGGSSGGGGGAGGMPGFTPNQNLVHRLISQCQGDEGVHREEITNRLRGKVGIKELHVILDFLSNEGHIYATKDDDHFAVTS